jgi:hypothetical protein
MQFHDFVPCRPRGERGTNEEFLDKVIRSHSAAMSYEAIRAAGSILGLCSPVIERLWRNIERPYYNVYPIAIELARKVNPQIQWADICLPVTPCLLRFPVGMEPHGIKTVLVHSPNCRNRHAFGWSFEKKTPELEWMSDRSRDACRLIGRLRLAASFDDTRRKPDVSKTFTAMVHGAATETVSDLIVLCQRKSGQKRESLLGEATPEQEETVLRLIQFIALVADGNDLITPAILEKDRSSYQNSDDAAKAWLEDRAARVAGRGFDLGKKIQEQKDCSPHWRNPHMALFWTGEGRQKPVLKMRSGCVVIPRHMSDVPTGFFAQDVSDEQRSDKRRAFRRAAVSKRMRFAILSRDGFRCQLCGKAQADGITLEVDHKTSVAKGGASSKDNLWTLCHDCNNGKSDSDMAFVMEATDGTQAR